MSIHDSLPGINRRVPADLTNLAFDDEVKDEELRERLRLTFAGNLSSASPGIVSDTDPSAVDPTDTTQPLLVRIDPGDPGRALVRPGRSVTRSGHRIVLTEELGIPIPNYTTPGTQVVIYAQYRNVETTPKPVRNRVGDVPSRREVVPEIELLHADSRAVYEGLSNREKTRSTVLCLITVQALEDGSTQTVLDLGKTVVSYNRPWFSVVDMVHRSQIGSGTPTSNNPHGTTANDVAVVGDLTLYQALIGRGVIIAPAQSLGGIPGTLCTEVIPSSRFVEDTAGVITGVVGAKYVELLGYPVAMGSCVRINGDEDTPDANVLAMHLVHGKDSDTFPTAGRTAVAYVHPEEPTPDGATYELRYTCVKTLEPPVNFSTDPEVTFGTPVGKEVVVTDGLAFNTVPDPVLTTESLGPIARRVYVLFDDSLGLVHIPQVLQPFTRLSSVADSITLDVPFMGPGRLRVWLADAIAGATMEVELTLNGTDADGAALSETIVFGSSWANNPVPSTFEIASQGIDLEGQFHSLETITIDGRVDDGPNSAILVELIPDGISQQSDVNYPMPVAYAHWDGYHFERMTDAREIAISLKDTGPGRASYVAESVLTHHAIWPANETNISHVFSDDSDNMLNSDLRLTRRWAPRGVMGTDDPTKLSSSRPAADNASYYSRAFRPINDTRWLMVVLHGTPRSVDVQVRFTLDDAPGAWSSFVDLDPSDVIQQGRAPASSTMAYYKFLPDLPAVAINDTAFKMQIRVKGDWSGLSVFVCKDDPHQMTFDFLVQALDDAFQVQHWGPGTPDEGKHKNIRVVPDSNGIKIAVERHAGDVAATQQMVILGRDMSNNPITALSMTAGGDLETFKSVKSVSGIFTGDVTAGGNINGSGTVVATGSIRSLTGDLLATDGGVFVETNLGWNDAQSKYIQIPMADVGMQIEQGTNIVAGTMSYNNHASLEGSGLQIFGITGAGGAAPEFWIDITAYTLSNGSVLKSVEITLAPVIVDGVSHTLEVKLQSSLLGGSTLTWTDLSTDTQTYTTADSGFRATQTFAVDEPTFTRAPLGLSQNYRLYITNTAGNPSFFIYRIALMYEVSTVDNAVHVLPF